MLGTFCLMECTLACLWNIIMYFYTNIHVNTHTWNCFILLPRCWQYSQFFYISEIIGEWKCTRLCCLHTTMKHEMTTVEHVFAISTVHSQSTGTFKEMLFSVLHLSIFTKKTHFYFTLYIRKPLFWPQPRHISGFILFLLLFIILV